MDQSELPKGWAISNVDALGEFINGVAFKPADWVDSGTPIIRIQNLTDPDKPLNRTEREVDEKYVVNRNDILVSWSATLDTFRWHGPRAYVNQHIFKVVPNPALDEGYVFYALKVSIDELINSEHLHGTTMKHINRKPFLAHPRPLPPLNEQRRIVEKIETLFARLDQGEADLRQVQTLLARYRQSVLKAAVSGQLTADWRAENAHRLEHGREEAGWQAVTLGELLEDIRYGTAKKCRPESQGTAVLRIPNVVGGRIDLDDLKFTELDDKEFEKLALKEGDVLVVRSNGSAKLVGRGAVVSQKAVGLAFAGYLIRLRVDQTRLLPRFLDLVLNSPTLRSKIERDARSTSGVHNINSSEIKAISFALPPLTEQVEIVDSVEVVLDRIDQLDLWCQTELTRSTALRQSILKQAFAGRLVAQDPNDEPASELLARIRAAQLAAKGQTRKKVSA